MAAPGSINDGAFADRVKKTFGSLLSSAAPSGDLHPLWSLAGGDVEKREWRRDEDTSARDSTPASSSFEDFFSHSRRSFQKNLESYRKEVEEAEEDGDGDGGGGESEWEVRSSIGMDPTLDNEDEEDAYDKVATGRENAGDRLYMRDAVDSDSHIDFETDNFSGTFGNNMRDPRANHLSARDRLKEDDAEAAKARSAKARKYQTEPPSCPTVKEQSVERSEDARKLRPILKRKEPELTSKPPKQVRFDPAFVDDSREAPEKTEEVSADAQVTGPSLEETLPRVPDYIRNPSKYTCYSLDSGDEVNEKSNAKAYMDFLNLVKKPSDDAPVDLPKSVLFIPKKKTDSSKNDMEESKEEDGKRPGSSHSTSRVGIAVGEDDIAVGEDEKETDVGEMEVDEPELSAPVGRSGGFRKPGRQYRAKSMMEESV